MTAVMEDEDCVIEGPYPYNYPGDEGFMGEKIYKAGDLCIYEQNEEML